MRSSRPNLVRSLLLDIFRGAFAGGDRLVEQELARHFGVSRTPVREALRALGAIGMVRIKPNCGVIVRPFGPAQLREIYHVRGLLEGEAARLACDRLGGDELRQIHRETSALAESPRRSPRWSKRVAEVDQRLHELLACRCGNERLAEEISRYRELVETIREAIKGRFKMQQRVAAEHLEIVEALLREDADAAARAMCSHIEQTANSAAAVMFPKEARPA